MFFAASAACPQSTGTTTAIDNVGDSSGSMVANAKFAVRNLETPFIL
jgi:hypothetical protein